MKKSDFIKSLQILKKEFPSWNAPVEELLNLKKNHTPYQLLISTLLSLRTKDEVTIPISKNLFAQAKTLQEMVQLPIEDIEKIIFKIGFYKQKSRTIMDISQRLLKEFEGQVPSNIDDLLSFKGIGRKTAALVLSIGFNIPAICVDVHVHRICNRFGFIKTKSTEETEYTLMKKIPDTSLWKDINYLLVGFGQTICTPVSPYCSKCSLSNICKKVRVKNHR